MPARVPNNLPAAETLTNENVFVPLSDSGQTLQILTLNLMPTKTDTETQLTRLLGNSPLQAESWAAKTASPQNNARGAYAQAFYKTFEQIKQNYYYDGMIVTGAPVEPEFEEVDAFAR